MNVLNDHDDADTIPAWHTRFETKIDIIDDEVRRQAKLLYLLIGINGAALLKALQEFGLI